MMNELATLQRRIEEKQSRLRSLKTEIETLENELELEQLQFQTEVAKLDPTSVPNTIHTCIHPHDFEEQPDGEVIFKDSQSGNWVCKVCGKQFTTKGSAKRHNESTHRATAKQFECPKCEFRCPRRDELYKHVRRVHGDEELVQSMIAEHKSCRKSQLINVISHDKHLDFVLPSGTIICRPSSRSKTEFIVSNSDAAAADIKRVQLDVDHKHSTDCGHRRLRHDNHDDFVVGNTIQSKTSDCILHGSSLLDEVDLEALSDLFALSNE